MVDKRELVPQVKRTQEEHKGLKDKLIAFKDKLAVVEEELKKDIIICQDEMVAGHSQLMAR
jgi:hypothetical protein